MRKIRQFKIPVHYKEIFRRVTRAEINLQAAGIDSDISFREFLNTLAAELEPGVVYDSFDKEFDLFGIMGLPHKTAFSAAALTLGPKIEPKIAAIAEPAAREAALIAASEFLDNAASFVCDLIKEEAAREHFEIPDYTVLAAPTLSGAPCANLRFTRNNPLLPAENAANALPAVFDRLNADKIGLLLESGNIRPGASLAFAAPWQAKRKKK